MTRRRGGSTKRIGWGSPGGAGARTSASGSGARSARTTAPDGDAWCYFPHDHARSRAYRWGEDGIAGICDDKQRLVLRPGDVERPRPDPQGADVRPHQLRGQPRRGRQGVLLLPRQHADPLVPELPLQVPAGGVPVRRPRRDEPGPRAGPSCEYELLDTGVFDDDRYFDVDVEYAKAAPEDLLVRITVHNRGPEPATLHLLPTLLVPQHLVVAGRRGAKPALHALADRRGIAAEHAELGTRRLVLRRRRPRCCSPRTRPTPSGSTAAPNRLARSSRTGSTVTSSTARPAPSTRTGAGTKAAAHYVARRPGRRQRDRPAAAGRQRRPARTRSRPSSTS